MGRLDTLILTFPVRSPSKYNNPNQIHYVVAAGEGFAKTHLINAPQIDEKNPWLFNASQPGLNAQFDVIFAYICPFLAALYIHHTNQSVSHPSHVQPYHCTVHTCTKFQVRIIIKQNSLTENLSSVHYYQQISLHHQRSEISYESQPIVWVWWWGMALITWNKPQSRKPQADDFQSDSRA